MISVHDIAREYGLNDKEAATILDLSELVGGIGLDNFFVNTPAELCIRKLLTPHQKRAVEKQE